MRPSLGTDIHRRTFLRQGAASLGLLGLHSLLVQTSAAQTNGVVNPLHHPAKAKRVIFLYQAGGPSHLETFDFKPKLAEMHGKPMPESFTKGQQIAQLQNSRLICYGPQHKFQRFGKANAEICDSSRAILRVLAARLPESFWLICYGGDPHLGGSRWAQSNVGRCRPIWSGRGTGFKRGASDGSAVRAFRTRFGPSLSGWLERTASIALPGRAQHWSFRRP